MNYSKDDLINMQIINSLIELGSGEKKSFLKEIIELYMQQAPMYIEGIKKAFYEKDALKMSKTAHSLKGASLNVGAKLLAELCKNIEIKGKNNDLSNIDNILTELEEVYNYTLNELNKF